MLTVPYKLQHSRPFHTADGDVCVSWSALFLTVLRFRAQVCLEDLKTQTSHPLPKTKQKKTKKKEGGKKNQKGKKTPSWGFLCKLCAVPFYFKICWQMTKTNI